MAGLQGRDLCGCLSNTTALPMQQRKGSSETAAHPAAKGHKEHRPVSGTELGRKPFNPDWEIFREL